jgi:hypothetical protein
MPWRAGGSTQLSALNRDTLPFVTARMLDKEIGELARRRVAYTSEERDVRIVFQVGVAASHVVTSCMMGRCSTHPGGYASRRARA